MAKSGQRVWKPGMRDRFALSMVMAAVAGDGSLRRDRLAMCVTDRVINHERVFEVTLTEPLEVRERRLGADGATVRCWLGAPKARRGSWGV